ncbi:ComEC/Rec2 family competence protein [Edaphobacter dinghuensis]|uniref:DNA internalization-related competence protein ComEC/Rec2 n=1 Tax=Edaphobacter dinghuensis TaxID=1560005 RepID=A0A917H177_9BACT|nr:ComEC/Rec2 family competence protein [Edaphobacter dinghuensis]GGG63564.1 DNA internalization-related competence protein ComEC/Rec2 [Edaphobacter dinghuensis]
MNRALEAGKSGCGPNPKLWREAGTERLRFGRAPLLAAAAWFAVGEIMARNRQPAIVLLIALVALVGLALAGLRWSLRSATLALAAIWMVVGMWCAEVQPSPAPQTALQNYADGLSRQVRGRVVRVRELPPRQKAVDQDNDPAWWLEKEPDAADAVSVDLAVEDVEYLTPDISRMVPVPGGVRVTVLADAGSLPDLKCGDVIEGPMRLKVPERYRDPGAWQYADYLLAQGLGFHATVKARKMTMLGMGARDLQCRVYAAQSWASDKISAYVRSSPNRRMPPTLRLSTDDAGMLNAMLFGDRTGLNRALRLGFERTGSFHLFVVSGMHVALLAGLVFWVTRRLRLSEWLATLLTIGLTAGYALLTGFGVPVQRALWMVAIFLVARLLSRDRNVLNALGAAALGVLVWSPGSLFEASFQMTFLAIIAIGGIAVPLWERGPGDYARAARHLWDEWEDVRLHPEVAQFRVMLRVWGEAFAELLGRWARGVPALMVRYGFWALELGLIGVIVELVMVLPMAVYFHRATVFALPANMLSVPLVAVLAPMAVVTFCAMLVSPALAMLPGAATAFLLHGIADVIGRVSQIRTADMRIPGPVWPVALLAVVGWGFCCWAVRRSRAWSWVAVAVLPLIAAMVLWPERPVTSPGMLEVTAIDVGQGDSLLVVSPEGKAMLVDAGGPVGGPSEAAAASSGFDVGEEVVAPYLWSRRIRRLDVVALSHAHSDHMGGMPAILRDFRPRELWVGIDPDSEAYRELLAEAKKLGVAVKHFHAGEDLVWGGTEISMLAPEPTYRNDGAPVNDDSLVMRMQSGKASVLLEGDAEAPSERAMVADGKMQPMTLLKVGHHGSNSSTTPEFFAEAAPKDAVISVGKGNTFGHPRVEVIDRIAAAHTRLYRTDEFGLTTFLLGRDGGIREVTGAGDE